jgi:tRNA(Ile)-lysidine synthase
MPVVSRLNPRIQHALARLAASVADDTAYLDVLAATAFAEIAEAKEATIALDRLALVGLPAALASRVLRLTFAELHGSAADLEYAHIDAILDALHGATGSHSLPGGITATLDQSYLTLSRGPLPRAGPIPEVALAVPGRTGAGAWLIETSLGGSPATPATQNPLQAHLDADKVGSTLIVRSRRPGDHLRPLGLGGDKKLQDVLVDAKVPVRDRDGVPLVCADHQIAWVVGHCIDERFALTTASIGALHLTASLTTDDYH